MDVVWLWWVWCSILVVWWISLPTSEKRRDYTVRLLRFEALQEAVYEKKVSLWTALALMCQSWLFPVFLAVLLVVLAIQQLNTSVLQRSSLFHVLGESWLVWVTCLIGMVAWSIDTQTYDSWYERQISPTAGWLYLLLCLWLALCGSYLVWVQTQEMWTLSWILSPLVGYLLVLMGNLFE